MSAFAIDTCDNDKKKLRKNQDNSNNPFDGKTEGIVDVF